MKNENKVMLAVFGFVSGLVSYYTVIQLKTFFLNIGGFWKDAPLWYGPGVFFGVAAALYVLTMKKGKSSLPHILIWILVSTIAYTVAVQTTITILSVQNNLLPFALVVAGVLGATIMLLGFHALISKLSLGEYVGLAVLGGILGLSFWLGNGMGDAPFQNMNAFLLYTVWQMGMAAALGHVLDKNKF